MDIQLLQDIQEQMEDGMITYYYLWSYQKQISFLVGYMVGREMARLMIEGNK